MNSKFNELFDKIITESIQHHKTIIKENAVLKAEIERSGFEQLVKLIKPCGKGPIDQGGSPIADDSNEETGEASEYAEWHWINADGIDEYLELRWDDTGVITLSDNGGDMYLNEDGPINVEETAKWINETYSKVNNEEEEKEYEF